MNCISYKAVFVCLMLFCSNALSAEQGKWTWDSKEGESLSLKGSQGMIWRINFAKDLPHFYFDPLCTGQGLPVGWLSPPDHRWHYGLWFSWKTINKVNYWEIPAGKQYPVGRTIIDSATVLKADDTGAEIEIRLSLSPSETAPPVAKEVVKLCIGMPQSDGSYTIDWRQTTTALEDIEFGCSSGYAGLSLRASRKWQEARFLNSNGTQGLDGHLQTANWTDMSANIEDSILGVTMFDHPSNPRHPTQWFLVDKILRTNTPNPWPFFYLNAAIIGGKPLPLAKGQSLTFAYRILVHADAWDKSRLDSEYVRFAELPLKKD